MRLKPLNQDGLIPMLLFFFALIIAAIIFVYLRVINAG